MPKEEHSRQTNANGQPMQRPLRELGVFEEKEEVRVTGVGQVKEIVR